MILSLLMSASVKAALLLGAAWLITRLARQGSAACRHQVWALAVFGVLALPVLQLALPAWHASRSVPGSELWRAAVSNRVAEPAALTTSVDAIPARPPAAHWTVWIIGIWLTGAGWMLSRLIYGLAVLSRGGSRATDARLLQTVERCAQKLGIGRSVMPLLSPETHAMPCTWGVAYPKIQLPRTALEWPQDRLEMVLTHELAHIQRLDWPVRLMAETARAIFWFHPLVWLAASRLRDESERACDDAVLVSGEDAARYASELLDLIRHARKSPAAALAVARHSHFERRFTSMLDPTRNRRRLTRKAAFCSTAAALLCLLPLASVQAPAEESAGQFSGSVVDSSGVPVPNATVIMTNIQTHDSKMTGTDATGAYQLDALPPGSYERQVTREGYSDLVFSPQLIEPTINAPGPVTVMSKGEPAKGIPSTSHLRIGGGVAAANVVHQSPPTYPADAKAAGISGTVALTALIHPEGRVLSVRVQNTDVNPALGRAAIEAVSQWRYKPTLLNGNPMEVETTVNVNFTLSQ